MKMMNKFIKFKIKILSNKIMMSMQMKKIFKMKKIKNK